MKITAKILITTAAAGILYSLLALLTGHRGSGPGDFFDGLSYTSIALFLSSLTLLFFHRRQIRQHKELAAFLLLSAPLSIISISAMIRNYDYDRTPDLVARYPEPVSTELFLKDSTNIVKQIDSIIARRNLGTNGTKIHSAVIDTIIYSQPGKEIFVVYAEQYEPNAFGNDLRPAYLFADKKDSIYWHLDEEIPVAEQLIGNYHTISDLKLAVRKFYFNRYSFSEKDNRKENYFWKN